MELDTADSVLIELKSKVALLGGNDVTQGRNADFVGTRSRHIRAFMRPSMPLKDFGTPPGSIPSLSLDQSSLSSHIFIKHRGKLVSWGCQKLTQLDG